jgi:hypothetical protein
MQEHQAVVVLEVEAEMVLSMVGLKAVFMAVPVVQAVLQTSQETQCIMQVEVVLHQTDLVNIVGD